MAELILKLRSRKLASIPVESVRTTIGRDAACDVRIDNVGVSRLHATVEVVQGEARLVDHGSSNGTYVNGVRVSNVALRDGDEIAVGKHSILFVEGSGLPSARPSAAPIRHHPTIQGMPTSVPPTVTATKDVIGTVHMTTDEVARAMASGKLAAIRRAPEPRPQEPARPGPATRFPVALSLWIVAIAVAAAVVYGLASGRWPPW